MRSRELTKDETRKPDLGVIWLVHPRIEQRNHNRSSHKQGQLHPKEDTVRSVGRLIIPEEKREHVAVRAHAKCDEQHQVEVCCEELAVPTRQYACQGQRGCVALFSSDLAVYAVERQRVTHVDFALDQVRPPWSADCPPCVNRAAKQHSERDAKK